jgi:hypothetical protein
MKYASAIVIALTSIFLTLTGCKKEETETVEQSTTATATAGMVIVNVKQVYNWDFEQSQYPAQGAIIRIATSLENIDRGIYLKELTTDVNGQVKFEQLLPGEYYIDGYSSGFGQFFEITQVQIIAGQTRQHEIVFYW